RADRGAHPRPAVAVALEVAVRELDAGPVGRLRDEADLYLARLLGVGLDLPVEVDVPAEDEPVRRLVGEHARPLALAAVDATVVDAPAGARLDHHLGELRLEDVVLGRPPRSHP